MSFPVKPIFLLADSQLLFWRDDDEHPFLERVRAELGTSQPKAAYLGAANGDQPEFFDLFKGAMASVGIEDCRMIPSEPNEDDLEYFDQAHLVLLAGGDPRLGWRAFRKSGLKQKIVERYYGGAVLIGVSAGAVQLGLYGSYETEDGRLKLFETFKLVPAVVDAHDEPEWKRLSRMLDKADEQIQGLGIPSGAGAILHQDLTLEPVRRSLVEFSREDEDAPYRQSLIFPPSGDEEPEEQEKPAVMPDAILGPAESSGIELESPGEIIDIDPEPVN